MKQRASNATRRGSNPVRVATCGHAVLGRASCLAAGRQLNGNVRAMRTVEHSLVQGMYATNGALPGIVTKLCELEVPEPHRV